MGVLELAENRSFSGSGRSRALKPSKEVGGFAPHRLGWFKAPRGRPDPENDRVVFLAQTFGSSRQPLTLPKACSCPHRSPRRRRTDPRVARGREPRRHQIVAPPRRTPVTPPPTGCPTRRRRRRGEICSTRCSCSTTGSKTTTTSGRICWKAVWRDFKSRQIAFHKILPERVVGFEPIVKQLQRERQI